MSTTAASGQPALRDEQHVSLCETLDRVLNKGVVVVGEVVISVADIDLIYLGLQLVLTSVETANQGSGPGGAPRCRLEGA
jgi:hypothetical protein